MPDFKKVRKVMVPGGGRILSIRNSILTDGGTHTSTTKLQRLTRPRVPLCLSDDHRPHPYSEAADHERRELEDPLSGARGVIQWALALAAALALVTLATCSAFGQQFYYRTTGGNQDRIDIVECTGGALFPALLQFNAWYSNGTWVRLTGEVHSVCTVLIAYPNVTWTRRASFSLHAVTVGGDVARDATRSLMTVYGPDFVERMPARLLACLPPPRDWTHTYITIEADEMTRILDTGECPGALRRPG